MIFLQALEYYNRCLELHRRTLPPTHHLIPDTLNNIGALYKSMLRWEDCARVLEEALQVMKIKKKGLTKIANASNEVKLGTTCISFWRQQ